MKPLFSPLVPLIGACAFMIATSLLQAGESAAMKEQLNTQLGREVFVNIDALTDKVYTGKEVKKWYGPRNSKSTNLLVCPEELQGRGVREVVEVWVTIDPEGYPLNPQINNLEHKELVMPILQHLATMRFATPKFEGEAVYLRQKVNIFCADDPVALKEEFRRKK